MPAEWRIGSDAISGTRTISAASIVVPRAVTRHDRPARDAEQGHRRELDGEDDPHLRRRSRRREHEPRQREECHLEPSRETDSATSSASSERLRRITPAPLRRSSAAARPPGHAGQRDARPDRGHADERRGSRKAARSSPPTSGPSAAPPIATRVVTLSTRPCIASGTIRMRWPPTTGPTSARRRPTRRRSRQAQAAGKESRSAAPRSRRATGSRRRSGAVRRPGAGAWQRPRRAGPCGGAAHHQPDLGGTPHAVARR